MPRRTSFVLTPPQEREIIKQTKALECSQSDAIRYFLDRGMEAEQSRRLFELMTLRIFFYLRQIAKERGNEFVLQLERDFAEVGQDMLDALHEGVAHVGK